MNYKRPLPVHKINFLILVNAYYDDLIKAEFTFYYDYFLIYIQSFVLFSSCYQFFIKGDRITSLTIDFQHIVQEDAMTILSYASPYNVQLELMNGNNKLRASGSSSKASVSPGPGRQSPLVHPLCRSSSQSDRNTVSI